MRESERESADTCHIYTVLLPASPAGTRRPKKKKKYTHHIRSAITTQEIANKKEDKGVGGDKQKEQKVRKIEDKKQKRKEKGQREKEYIGEWK